MSFTDYSNQCAAFFNPFIHKIDGKLKGLTGEVVAD